MSMMILGPSDGGDNKTPETGKKKYPFSKILLIQESSAFF